MKRRHVLAAVLACALLAPEIAPAAADAQLQISSFSLAPSSTRAGGDASHAGPDVTIDTRFSTRDGDTPRDVTLSLAPGIAARLAGIPLCSQRDFEREECSNSSRIGTGSITGTAPQWGFTLSLPVDAYLIVPQGSEPARIGLIVTFFDYPVATQTGPLRIRTSPDVGIDIPLDGLPNQIDGTRVIIDGLRLTIFGSVNGAPFTRNPTSCSPATSTLTADSYGDPSTPIAQQSSFTPTGCDSLPYAPTIAGTASRDATDDGLGLSTVVTQHDGEADDQSVQVTLPFSASPRLSALNDACTASDLNSCPSVGSATVLTPLLAQQLDAKVVLVAHQGSIPTLAILIPQPFGIELDATPILSGNAVQALISNIPDLPISNLTLNLPGGPNSLFRAGTHLCSRPQTFSAQFTAWSGASASPSSPATVTGCPGQGGGGSAAPARRALSPPRAPGAGRPVHLRGRGGLLGYSARDGRLTVAIGAGRRLRRLRSLTIRLPRGLAIDAPQLPRGIAVSVDGRRVTASIRCARDLLRITLAHPGRVAIVQIAAPALRGRPLRHRLRALVTARGARGEHRTLRLSG